MAIGDVQLVSNPRLLSLYRVCISLTGKDNANTLLASSEPYKYIHVSIYRASAFVAFIIHPITFIPALDLAQSIINAAEHMARGTCMAILTVLRQECGDMLVRAPSGIVGPIARPLLKSLSAAFTKAPLSLASVSAAHAMLPGRLSVPCAESVSTLIHSVTNPFALARDPAVTGYHDPHCLVAGFVAYRDAVIWETGRPEVLAPMHVSWLTTTAPSLISTARVSTRDTFVPDAGDVAPVWNAQLLSALARLSAAEQQRPLPDGHGSAGVDMGRALQGTLERLEASFRAEGDPDPLEDVLALVYETEDVKGRVLPATLVTGKLGEIYISLMYIRNIQDPGDPLLSERAHTLLYSLVDDAVSASIEEKIGAVTTPSSLGPITSYVALDTATGRVYSTCLGVLADGGVDPLGPTVYHPRGCSLLHYLWSDGQAEAKEVKEGGGDSIVTFGRAGKMVVAGRGTLPVTAHNMCTMVCNMIEG
ncbi:hypothetical protein J8273_2140 [Carpediemonas membranifera]|uniref:Uncharacterized protein n=1 Tax=Carpediemonas membranifera TaxID=201153 RepID=A0A8J6B8F9_9EUKA|nr:hypothetical protein J8273_2140 [Carpediemonas membranifera]|eukprot:KAG9396409.1 hypothetical protein J8273_2140 [Carpediemonas membranifera]